MDAIHPAMSAGDGQQHTQLGMHAAAAQTTASQAWDNMSALQHQDQQTLQPHQIDSAHLAVLQQPVQQMDPHATILTPEQLNTLSGALGGTDIAAISSNELLQRLMEAQGNAAGPQQQATVALPPAPELISHGYLQGAAAAGAAGDNEGSAAVQGTNALQVTGYDATQAAQHATGVAPGALGMQDQQYQQHDAAAAADGAGVPPEHLQMQLQHQNRLKRKAGDAGEPPADTDVADILLAMAGDPKLAAQQQQQLAAAAAAAGQAAGGAIGGMQVNSIHQQGLSDVAGPAAAGAAGASGSEQLVVDVHGQQVALNMAGHTTVADAAGNVLQLSGIDSTSGGLVGVTMGVQGLAGQQMLQQLSAEDLSRLQASTQGYGTVPGMHTLQLVQLPMQGAVDVTAVQQHAAAATAGGYAAADGAGQTAQLQGQDEERPHKRLRADVAHDEAAAAAAGVGILNEQHHQGDAMAGVGDAGVDAQQQQQPLEMALPGSDQPGMSEQQLVDELQRQAADANTTAAATALGTVVNVNGVNMLIPAAPQLQLQLAPDGNVQEQLLALQQQVHLAQIPVMAGLGGIQLPASMAHLAAGAAPDHIQQLQQHIQLQQQIQQLQLQQQLQLMQLQLASQQGIVLAPGARLGFDGDSSGHMVRRHGMLPERIVTREMLKQVFHLPIEEAAKQLGIGQTMLKHYCRKFGIPRWPYRKRQSVVQLIQSIENYAQDKPMSVEPALQKLRSFLNQIDEDPNIDLDGPIKRLRQAFFKEAYKARVRTGKGSDVDSDGRGARGGRVAGGGGMGGRTEAWLENLCQAIVDSHPELPSAGGYVTRHEADFGGGEMGDGDEHDYAVGTDEMATVAALAAHSQQQHEAAAAAAAHHAAVAAGLDPNALAVSMAAVAQLTAGVQGAAEMGAAQHHSLDELQMAAAAAAQAQADQVAALHAAAAVQEQQQ